MPWPLGVGFWEQASNHSKLLRSKAVVVSVGVKVTGGPVAGMNWRDEGNRTVEDASKICR